MSVTLGNASKSNNQIVLRPHVCVISRTAKKIPGQHFPSTTLRHSGFKIRELKVVRGTGCKIAVFDGARITPLYGLRYTRYPPPTHPPYRVPLAELTFHLFLFKIRPSVYMTIPNPSRGMRQLGLPRQIC